MSPTRTWLAAAFRRHPLLAGVTGAYVAAWTAYGIAVDTGQVYTYLAWMVCAVGLVMYVDRRVPFSTHVLVLLSIVGFCHMAGGNLYIEGVVLYEQIWLGFIRYDHHPEVAESPSTRMLELSSPSRVIIRYFRAVSRVATSSRIR